MPVIYPLLTPMFMSAFLRVGVAVRGKTVKTTMAKRILSRARANTNQQQAPKVLQLTKKQRAAGGALGPKGKVSGKGGMLGRKALGSFRLQSPCLCFRLFSPAIVP